VNALQSLLMAPTTSEARLTREVSAAAAGDRQAYARLVDDTRNLVTAISLSIVRDVATSEDVAQEVYLQAWQGLQRLRNPASFLPWLRQLTRNRAHDEARRRARRRSEPLDYGTGYDSGHGAGDDRHRDPRPDAGAQLIAVEEQAALAAALDELPDAAREVVTLYYREGRSVAQVAGLIGLSDVAVKKRLSRARELLRADVLDRLGEAVTRSAPAAAFTAAVLGAITAGAPATASAALLGKTGGALGGVGKAGALLAKAGGVSLAAKLLGVLGGVVGGALGGALGVIGGVRKIARRARDDEERRALARFTIVNVAAVIVGALAMPLGHALWPGGPGLFAGFSSMWIVITLSYTLWLPRITARRHALERAEDPHAAARQRREARLSMIALAFGSLVGYGTCAAALWLSR
jgi:RNA polymerase sigma factor (sigma-70 family)